MGRSKTSMRHLQRCRFRLKLLMPEGAKETNAAMTKNKALEIKQHKLAKAKGKKRLKKQGTERFWLDVWIHSKWFVTHNLLGIYRMKAKGRSESMLGKKKFCLKQYKFMYSSSVCSVLIHWVSLCFWLTAKKMGGEGTGLKAFHVIDKSEVKFFQL